MEEQEFVGDEIVHAAEEWQQVVDLTETVSNENTARELAGVALSQFKTFHGLVNERLENIDERSQQLIEDGQLDFHQSSADKLVFLSQERQDLINFTHSLYPEESIRAETADSKEVDIENAVDEIREELGDQDLAFSREGEIILRQFLSQPETELTKHDFIAAGFPKEHPSLFTGIMKHIADRINSTYTKLRIEKVTQKKSGRTRAYKLVFKEGE